jgi:hypothetical protein
MIATTTLSYGERDDLLDGWRVGRASEADEILAERSSIRVCAEAAVAFTEARERPATVSDLLP